MDSSDPRRCNLGLTRSAVSTISLLLSAPPLRLAFLNGPACNHFKEHCLPVLDLAQHSSQALDIFACSRSAAQHNSDFRLRHIDTLVQHSGRDNHAIASCLKAIENLLAFGCAGFMGNCWNKMTAGDVVNHAVVLGEDQHPLRGIFMQQRIERPEFALTPSK